MARPHNKQFFVYLAHKAIHPEVMQHGDGSVNLAEAERFIPAERHRKLFVGKNIPRRPNAMRSPAGKLRFSERYEPACVGTKNSQLGRGRVGPSTIADAIEEGVGEIL